ncbi:MAG: hypothetical protein MZW92_76455 [Comamonadaceae bacterium]|nr:hypothetical protein [Comamonadaceae bacterium]
MKVTVTGWSFVSNPVSLTGVPLRSPIARLSAFSVPPTKVLKRDSTLRIRLGGAAPGGSAFRRLTTAGAVSAAPAIIGTVTATAAGGGQQ